MLPTLTQIKANDRREELARAARHHGRMRDATPAAQHTHYRRSGRVVAPARRARIAALAVGLALATVTVAKGATPGIVVGPHGTVAGEGYGQWLRNSFQRTVSEPPGASVCQAEHVNGTLVAMLLGGYSGKPERHSCRLRAHTPIYVNGLFVECSTADKPPFHASTASQLKTCARRNFQGAPDLGATIDGRAVGNYRALISASPVYTITLPKHNILGSTKRTGRSAAYGEGLLLRELPAGSHTIQITGNVAAAGFHYQVTYAIHVAP
jgi:hypothetical protein